MISAKEFRANKKAYQEDLERRIFTEVDRSCEVALAALSTNIHIPLTDLSIHDLRANMDWVNSKLKDLDWRLEENREQTDRTLSYDNGGTFFGTLIEVEN